LLHLQAMAQHSMQAQQQAAKAHASRRSHHHSDSGSSSSSRWGSLQARSTTHLLLQPGRTVCLALVPMQTRLAST
jgi:hypothetical protein